MTSLFFKLAEQSPVLAILTAILLTVVWLMLRLWDKRHDERHQELVRNYTVTLQMIHAILRIVTVNNAYQTGVHPDINIVDGDRDTAHRGLQYLQHIETILQELKDNVEEVETIK